MNLTAEQILDNWKSLMSVIEDNFKGERRDRLKAMYEDLSDRMTVAPASSYEHFHNAFEGGYVDHVLRVIKCAGHVYETWKEMGADVSGFSKEELVFCALNHDLGKMGFPGEGNEVYQVNDSEWHRKNQGKLYKVNTKNPFALVNDLSIWLLQHYKIEVSWEEYLGIKLTDGLYDESNKPYFISRSPEAKLRTNLGLILHQADSMAARIEYERWSSGTPQKSENLYNIKKQKLSEQSAVDVEKIFNDLFK